jgi:hypothetical protein
MKKSIFSTVIIAIAFLTTSVVSAQKFKPLDKSPLDMASFPSSYKVSDKVVRITYGRPQLKGRDLATLAKPGKVWRTGANEAPEITFYNDVVFGGKEVAAGTYTLFTIPNEKEWTVILSNHKNVWGAYFYKEEMDVTRVMGKVSKVEEPIEAFSIIFDKDMSLVMGWGNTVVTVPISKK